MRKAGKKGEAKDGSERFQLPPKLESQLEKMGLSKEIAKLKDAMKGSDPTLREVQRLCPPTIKLSRVFRRVSPKIDRELSGSVVSCFWSSLLSAATLSEHLHELTRIKGKTMREDLVSLLAVIYEVEISSLWRQVECLRRDIPSLIHELGGAPSEELILPRKRSKKP